MLRRYPGTLRWRQALPPIFVISLLLESVLALILPVLGWLLVFELLAYFGLLGLAALRIAIKRKDFFLIIGLPLSIAVMHITWGSGFIWSIFQKSGINSR